MRVSSDERPVRKEHILVKAAGEATLISPGDVGAVRAEWREQPAGSDTLISPAVMTLAFSFVSSCLELSGARSAPQTAAGC